MGEEPRFTELCADAKDITKFPYSVFSMLSMILYYVLLIDLAVFNNRVSAFVLVCGRMIGEVSLFLIVSIVFLLNMLVAQLTCAYDAVYSDMVGYARLKRIRIIVESMPQVSEKRWQGFIQSLQLEQRIEFNEGDIGLSGGIQVLEPASAHPTTVDM